VSLGYRRPSTGRGAWIAKTTAGGGRAEERLGFADDEAGDLDALSFKAAVAAAIDWSSRQQAAAEEAGKGQRQRPTVRAAVEEYLAWRMPRPGARNSKAKGRLGKHVLSDPAFAGLGLHKLRAIHIQEWRERLALGETGGTLSPSSINRLLNDLRAALNAAAMKHRRGLPAHIFQEISIGTKALEAATQPRRQLLSDDQVRGAIDAAFRVDESGDFGRLVLLLATTGARHSQVARLDVSDLQAPFARVMMPGSRKGRQRREKPPVAVPLSGDVVRQLLPIAEGRASDAPLLERWGFRKTSRKTCERTTRRRWGPAYEVDVWWPQVVELAELPEGTVMYALRHSSIVRGLRAMLPVRLVAALHDTSVEMIEQHYAAFIVDVTEDLARRATLSVPAVSLAA
jgi:integrase